MDHYGFKTRLDLNAFMVLCLLERVLCLLMVLLYEGKPVVDECALFKYFLNKFKIYFRLFRKYLKRAFSPTTCLNIF